jgi:hypothetical protein
MKTHFLFVCLIISVVFLSCDKGGDSLQEVTEGQIASLAFNELTSKTFGGTGNGKRQFQINNGDPIQTEIITSNDSNMQFQNTGSTTSLNLIEKGNINALSMTLCETNLQAKYVLFSNRPLSTTLIRPNNLQFEDHYCNTTGQGPESVIIYYFDKDSMIYFRNFSSNLVSGGGNPQPYNNFYLASTLKSK